MRKKNANTPKNAGRGLSTGRNALSFGLSKMVREGVFKFALAEVNTELDFVPLNVSSIGYMDYVTPGSQLLKIELNRRIGPNIAFEVKTANRAINRFMVEQLKAEKKKIKEMAAAIHELYMEEQNEIDAFANYIPAHIRKKKK